MSFSLDNVECFLVEGDPKDRTEGVTQSVRSISVSPQNEDPNQVLVRIHYSSINYKDALAATGHPGVARTLPLIPGIDAVGQVITSNHPDWNEGQRVIINGEDFGTSVDGGLRQAAWVPESWLLPVPDELSDLETITLGTAGITAAWCVDAILNNQTDNIDQPFAVTGSTGGVGSFAVEILGKNLDMDVVAVSGKKDKKQWLKDLGASSVISRKEFVDETSRPLLSARWAGGVDTVGSSGLTSLLRSTTSGGTVAACGLAAGPDLSMTVYPFILRGVVLYGIDCTRYSRSEKNSMWKKLAGPWRPEKLLSQAKVIGLDEISDAVFSLLDGKNTGRVVVDLK